LQTRRIARESTKGKDGLIRLGIEKLSLIWVRHRGRLTGVGAVLKKGRSEAFELAW